MEKILTIATIGITILSVVVTIINFILSKLKIVKNRQELEDENTTLIDDNEELNKSLKSTQGINKLITEIVPTAIEFVENSGIVGSELKEMLALSKILITCQSDGIEYDENTIKELITKLIDFTKQVNSNKVIEKDECKVVDVTEKVEEENVI